MSLYSSFFALVLAASNITTISAQKIPPWSKGDNDPAGLKGYVFSVPDIDNVPDLHGNPSDAKLVMFIGGNQFFVLPQLIATFEREHPELKGHIFYETLPPGILRKQIEAQGVLTSGNLTVQVKPDVYQASASVLRQMERSGQVKHVVEYGTNELEIMIPAGNPKGVQSLKDLRRPDLRLSMPNPQWEGVANQIAASLRKLGGDSLYRAVYQDKVKAGTTLLTEISPPSDSYVDYERAGGCRCYLGIRSAISTKHWESDSGHRDSRGRKYNGYLCRGSNDKRSPHGCGSAMVDFPEECASPSSLSPIWVSLNRHPRRPMPQQCVCRTYNLLPGPYDKVSSSC